MQVQRNALQLDGVFFFSRHHIGGLTSGQVHRTGPLDFGTFQWGTRAMSLPGSIAVAVVILARESNGSNCSKMTSTGPNIHAYRQTYRCRLYDVELPIQLTPLWCIALSYKRIMTTTLQLLLPLFLVTR